MWLIVSAFGNPISIYQQQYDPNINVISFYTFYFTNRQSACSCNGPDPAKNAIKC